MSFICTILFCFVIEYFIEKSKNGEDIYADYELVRLAIPRRTYTQSHIELEGLLKQEFYYYPRQSFLFLE